MEDGGAMKKGFDGVYTLKTNDWYLESKSGACKSSHLDKIKLAYKDLSEKFCGEVQNNPWLNALSHSKISKSKKTLVSKIEVLAFNFDNNNFAKTNDFNIIPCSTLIFEDKWEQLDLKQIKEPITRLISSYNYSKIIIVCINKKSLVHFKNYLNS